MRSKGFRLVMIVLGFLVIFPLVSSGAEIKVGKRDGKRRSSVELHVEAPSFGPPPRGYIYGGPYIPPYPFGYPQYYPYGWSNPYYPSMEEEIYQGRRLIPAGRLMILVDPVSAEVYVDGLRLQQHADLSYEVGLLEGRHKVRMRAEDYEPYEENVDIPGGKRLVLTIRLERAQ